MEIKHCDTLEVTQGFSFRDSAKGRAAIARPGDRFWVVSCSLSIRQNGKAEIARQGSSRRYLFPVAVIESNFKRVERC